MQLEEIIRMVTLARPEISREDLLKMIEKKKEEAIAKIIASELGRK